MLLKNLDEGLMTIMWPLIFYIPVLIAMSKEKRKFNIYKWICIVQSVAVILLLLPSPSANSGADMIGYGAVVVMIFAVQLFFIALSLLIMLISFLVRQSRKGRTD